MNHITKEEHLSAFLDGEAGSFEQQRVCDQLECDELMRKKLANYTVIGEVVRRQSTPQSQSVLAGDSFLKGIQDAIGEDEAPASHIVDESPVVLQPNVAKRRIFPKQAVGYAVAASVAAVAALSLQNYFNHDTPEMTASVPEAQESVLAESVMTAAITSPSAAPVNISQPLPEAIRYQQPDQEIRGMMDKYIAHHLQYASSATLMPGVRAVSYSTDY